MRTIREVLRLSWQCGLSNRSVGVSCHIGETAVRSYLHRATRAGLKWPLPDYLQDPQLEQMLFPPAQRAELQDRPMPDWTKVCSELKRKGVTLQLLWQEYHVSNPNGYCYSQYCFHYKQWKEHAEPRMPQQHKAGDKLFVDYCGVTVPIVHPVTGEISQAQIFVAALGASSYIYADATATQTVSDWIGWHVRCFQFLGGVPRLVVPDNLKSGVTSPCRYEPDLNPTYLRLATHYGIAVVPARVRKPRDKAKVGNAVQQVERRILACLRNHTFHSVGEINAAILPLLKALNAEKMKAFGESRQQLFEMLDQPALRPLPPQQFGEGIWRKARVNVDYHAVIDGHRYSVPYLHINTCVEVFLTDAAVELFAGNSRIASHRRSRELGGYTTIPEHMPPAHLQTQWQLPDFLAKASRHGAQTVKLIRAVIESRPVPEHAFRSCMGILRLADKYGSERIEAAATIALEENLTTYKSIAAILKNSIDKGSIAPAACVSPPIIHDNVRGADYYKVNKETHNA